MVRVKVDERVALVAEEVVRGGRPTAGDAERLREGEEIPNRVVVDGIDALHAESDSYEDNNRPRPPLCRLGRTPLAQQSGRTVLRHRLRCSEDVRLDDDAVRGHRDGHAGVRVRANESPAREMRGRRQALISPSQQACGKTDLMAPAAVLGPNHSPISFPSCFPMSAMRWTEKGA